MEYRNSGYRWKNTYPPFHQQEVNTNILKLLKKTPEQYQIRTDK